MVKAVLIGGPRHDEWVVLDHDEHTLPDRVWFPANGADYSQDYVILGPVTDKPYILLMYAGHRP